MSTTMSSASSKADIDAKRAEIMGAAMVGIHAMLRGSKGHRLFGQDSEVKKHDGKTLRIKDNNGDYFDVIVKQTR